MVQGTGLALGPAGEPAGAGEGEGPGRGVKFQGGLAPVEGQAERLIPRRGADVQPEGPVG